MSRKTSNNFLSKSAFDVLGLEADEKEIVEEEEEEVSPAADLSSSTSSLTNGNVKLSKSARKRLNQKARAAGKAGGGEASTASTASTPAAQESPKLGGDVKKVANDIVNATVTISEGDKVLDKVVAKEEVEESKAAVTEAHETKPDENSEEAKPEAFKATRSASSSSDGPRPIGSSFIPPVQPATNGVGNASGNPPSTKFAPELPADLPEPKGSALPSNRKRKTPTDFTPTGSRGNTPTSPSSKLGVKFEDGIAPGEGVEGEKTVPQVIVKNKNMIERTIMTFVMIFGFIFLLCAGHPFVILLVMVCQTLVYKEVTALFDLRDEGAKKTQEGDRWSKTLNWYFFVVCNYFLYGESIIYYFKHIVFVDAYFIPFARNHRFISFMLYVVGFVGFVSNLNKKYLRQQFALFCWVHISLMLIVVSSHFIINNILEGLVWFFVPASLVICNDVMAYVCGKAFGRTPLIKLSPKKTVEGFVGAFICTLIFAYGWGTFFMQFPYMICPARDLGVNALSEVSCRPNPVFIWKDFVFSGPVSRLLESVLGHPPPSIPYTPFQIHCLVMATFASLVAPFGGFFASGFKRAFNIKDFGHSIPGHGGMTDRMDCQFMMGLFSYVYYSSLIRIQYVTVGSIMQTIVTSLTGEEQLELLSDIKRFLDGQGIKVKL